MAPHQEVQLEAASSLDITILEAESHWARAAQTTPTILERCYRIGGLVVCVQFLDAVLFSRLTRAFGHLPEAPSSEASLTIKVLEASPLGRLFSRIRSDIAPGSNPRYLLRNTNHLALFQPIDGTVSLLDLVRGYGYYFITDQSYLSLCELAAPFRFILGSWLARCQLHLVHAAALGSPSGGVLLVGRGGSGKSTAALACLGSGIHYAADDNVIVSPGLGPMAFSLFSSGKLRPDNLSRFPYLAATIPARNSPVDDKSLYFVHEHYPQHVILQFPLRAILVTRHSGGPQTTIRPASRTEAVVALAPSTIFQLPGTGQAVLDLTKELVERVPSFLLETGSQLKTIPDSLINLLRRLES